MENTVKTVLVDDEELARGYLRELLLDGVFHQGLQQQHRDGDVHRFAV